MERCTAPGKEHTAYPLSTVPALEVPGVKICGKTGTAQLPGRLDEAWFICFAPRENPEIAVAVAIQGDKPGEGYGGGMEAAPVAAASSAEVLRRNQAIAPVTVGPPRRHPAGAP